MTTTNEKYDVLITELLDEVNGVRNKYDAFSQFTEAKVAEFVTQRRHLQQELEQRTQELEQRTQELEQRTQELERRTQELERRTQELERRTQDLAVTNAQRAQIQVELVKSTSLVAKLRTQRDKSRGRVRILESSRSYRFARGLRRKVPRFFRGK